MHDAHVDSCFCCCPTISKYVYVCYVCAYCIMWLTSLLFALVAQARCQLIAADLFTFVSWQEHEISSVCAAAARPANSAALQVFPLLPLQAALSSCRPPAEGRTLYKQTQAHRQWCIEILEKPQRYALMLGDLCSLKPAYKHALAQPT